LAPLSEDKDENRIADS